MHQGSSREKKLFVYQRIWGWNWTSPGTYNEFVSCKIPWLFNILVPINMVISNETLHEAWRFLSKSKGTTWGSDSKQIQYFPYEVIIQLKRSKIREIIKGTKEETDLWSQTLWAFEATLRFELEGLCFVASSSRA